MYVKVNPLTGEPAFPLDTPSKRFQWALYLRELSKRCLDECIERQGAVWEDRNLPKIPKMTKLAIANKRRAWLNKWKESRQTKAPATLSKRTLKTKRIRIKP